MRAHVLILISLIVFSVWPVYGKISSQTKVLLSSSTSRQLIVASPWPESEPTHLVFQSCKARSKWLHREQMDIISCEPIHFAKFKPEIAARLIRELPQTLEMQMRKYIPSKWSYFVEPAFKTAFLAWLTQLAIPKQEKVLMARQLKVYEGGQLRRTYATGPQPVSPSRAHIGMGYLLGFVTAYELLKTVQGVWAYYSHNEIYIPRDVTSLEEIMKANRVPRSAKNMVAFLTMTSVAASLNTILQNEYESELLKSNAENLE